MRGVAAPEGLGAVAGAALVVLVFAPWWSLETGDLGGDSIRSAPSSEIRGFLDASTGDSSLSAWDGTPRTAAVWILTGLLAIGLFAAARAEIGVYAHRALATLVAAAGAVAAGLAAWRGLDSPFASYATGTWAYVAIGACVLVTASAVASLLSARPPPGSA